MIRSPEERAQQDLNHDMLIAAYRGDFARMKECVQNGARVNVIGTKGMTALLYAAAHKDLDACKFLIARQAEVNHQNDDGMGVLHLAASITPSVASNMTQGELPKDYFALLELLVDAGAKLDPDDGKRLSPLFDTRALRADPKIIPLMIRAGADPDQHDAFGDTPLVHATRSNLPEATRELLHYPVNIEAKNRVGDTVLLMSMQQNSPFTALALITAGANIDIADAKGKTPEQYARAGGHDAILSAIFTMRAESVSRGTTKRVKLVHRINVRR